MNNFAQGDPLPRHEQVGVVDCGSNHSYKILEAI